MYLFSGPAKQGADQTNVWYIWGKTESYGHTVFPPLNISILIFLIPRAKDENSIKYR